MSRQCPKTWCSFTKAIFVSRLCQILNLKRCLKIGLSKAFHCMRCRLVPGSIPIDEKVVKNGSHQSQIQEPCISEITVYL